MMKLSIIIPVYNVEAYVAKCLDSLLSPALAAFAHSQSPEYEIIVVNDGSTDASSDIVQDYVNRYPELITLITTENRGQGHARNVGIEQAKGEFIYFIDSDDYLAENALEEMLDALELGHDIIIFDSIAVNIDQKPLRYIRGCTHNTNQEKPELTALILENPVVGNSLYRRKLYTESGVRFTAGVWFEDLRTMPKLYHYTDNIAYLPKAWHRYLQRAGSVTNTKNIRRNLEIIPAVDELTSFYAALPEYTELKDALDYMAFSAQFLTSSVRAILADPKSDVPDILIGDFLKKNPDFRENPYVKAMSKKHKLLTFLLLKHEYNLVYIIMKCNNLLKSKKV